MSEMTRLFPLRPYDAGAHPCSIIATASIAGQVFRARFELRGAEAIAFAPPAAAPSRKDELWKRTCFEAFLKPVTGEDYLELNASPSGDWNAYRFTRYREGMRAEAGIDGIEIDFDRETGVFEFRVDLSRTGLAGPWDVGLTAVLIEKTHGRESFWALEHSGPRPDFHLARSFVLRLP